MTFLAAKSLSRNSEAPVEVCLSSSETAIRRKTVRAFRTKFSGMMKEVMMIATVATSAILAVLERELACLMVLNIDKIRIAQAVRPMMPEVVKM